VRYVLIVGFTVFRSIGHEQEGARPAQGKKKDGEQNLETWHTEPAARVEPAARKSKGKKQEQTKAAAEEQKEKVALD
jgi:hypothetical protein